MVEFSLDEPIYHYTHEEQILAVLLNSHPDGKTTQSINSGVQSHITETMRILQRLEEQGLVEEPKRGNYRYIDSKDNYEYISEVFTLF